MKVDSAMNYMTEVSYAYAVAALSLDKVTAEVCGGSYLLDEARRMLACAIGELLAYTPAARLFKSEGGYVIMTGKLVLAECSSARDAWEKAHIDFTPCRVFYH